MVGKAVNMYDMGFMTKKDHQDMKKREARHGSGQTSGNKSRYSNVEQAIKSEIESGTFALGALLPSEHELCERFAVSRFTVRQALAQLRQKGFVQSRAGVGTTVIATHNNETFKQTILSTEELLQYPKGTYRKHLSIETVQTSAELAMMLQCSPGQTWSKLRALRVTRPSETAIAWLEIYLDPRFAGVFDQPNPNGLPTLIQVEQTFGHRAASAQIEIFVSRLSPTLGEHLNAEPNAPALVLLRRYRGEDGQIFLVTYSLHPENRFSLNFEFERSQH